MGTETQMSSYRVMDCKHGEPAFELCRWMVYSDFWKSLVSGNAWFHRIDESAFTSFYKPMIKHLIQRSIIRLAYLSDATDIYLGWSLFETDPSALHYVYVKEPFRKTGMGTTLLPKEFDRITHLTEDGYAWKRKHFNKVPFNPFL